MLHHLVSVCKFKSTPPTTTKGHTMTAPNLTRHLPANYRPGLSGYTVTEAIDGHPDAAAGRVRRLQHFTSKLKDGHVTREYRTICDDRTASGDRAVTAFELIRDTFGYIDAELYVIEHINTAA